MASLPQLVYDGHEALTSRELGEGREVDLHAFPSLKAMTYAVFHRYYAGKNRKGRPSEAPLFAKRRRESSSVGRK